MTDGWEYYAAKDLNIEGRARTRASGPSRTRSIRRDGELRLVQRIDFDGDGLTTKEEYRAWRTTGSSFIRLQGRPAWTCESPLGYSDGTKYSRVGRGPRRAAWRSPSYGLPAPTGVPGDLQLPDRRRLDRLGATTSATPTATGWQLARVGPRARPEHLVGRVLGQDDDQHRALAAEIDATSADPLCAQEPGYFTQRPFAELDLADRDVDGDTLLDGEDDQDNDDFTNIQELYEPLRPDADGQPAMRAPGRGAAIDRRRHAINPFNPCAPNRAVADVPGLHALRLGPPPTRLAPAPS